jgi:phosphate starvation-inducible protein PhoH and related proteins
MPDSLSFNEYYDDTTIIPLSKRQRRRLEKRKQQNGLRLQDIEPMTDTQAQVFDSYLSGKNLMCHGVAGTGKTFISSYLAIRDILEKYDDKESLQIVRSVVPTRDMGFLPGSQKEKSRVYEAPYYSIFGELFGRGDAYEVLKSRNQVHFTTTSFVRGLTFNDSIVIVDECQNMTYHELDSIITRLGDNCRVIFCGDFRQSDFKWDDERQGILNFMKIIKSMKSFDFVEFQKEDIVRSDLVKEYIINKLELGMH